VSPLNEALGLFVVLELSDSEFHGLSLELSQLSLESFIGIETLSPHLHQFPCLNNKTKSKSYLVIGYLESFHKEHEDAGS
jgi:hypothetical protein